MIRKKNVVVSVLNDLNDRGLLFHDNWIKAGDIIVNEKTKMEFVVQSAGLYNIGSIEGLVYFDGFNQFKKGDVFIVKLKL